MRRDFWLFFCYEYMDFSVNVDGHCTWGGRLKRALEVCDFKKTWSACQ